MLSNKLTRARPEQEETKCGESQGDWHGYLAWQWRSTTGVASVAAASSEAGYPTRPVHLIVPYAAGGGPDIQARKLAEVVSRDLGQPVVVENKVGAGAFLPLNSSPSSRLTATR
jgi:hypothetical protein